MVQPSHSIPMLASPNRHACCHANAEPLQPSRGDTCPWLCTDIRGPHWPRVQHLLHWEVRHQWACSHDMCNSTGYTLVFDVSSFRSQNVSQSQSKLASLRLRPSPSLGTIKASCVLAVAEDTLGLRKGKMQQVDMCYPDFLSRAEDCHTGSS